LQRTNKFRCLVRSNATGDPDRDFHTGRFYPRRSGPA
jgi:hypothetical protein